MLDKNSKKTNALFTALLFGLVGGFASDLLKPDFSWAADSAESQLTRLASKNDDLERKILGMDSPKSDFNAMQHTTDRYRPYTTYRYSMTHDVKKKKIALEAYEGCIRQKFETARLDLVPKLQEQCELDSAQIKAVFPNIEY
ncbi:MAG: hypothetical protein AAF244_00725 [Pseudomonadota bacterium]